MTDKDKSNGSPFGQADSYVRFLLARKGRVFYLKPWNGNSGDMLIWLGTERLLEDLKIPRTLDPRTADVILVPGGNQTMWQANIDVWKETWTRWPDKEFVVGPTTVQLGFTTWRQDIEATTATVSGIFARDPVSYQTLLRCGLSSRIETGLSHDPCAALVGFGSDPRSPPGRDRRIRPSGVPPRSRGRHELDGESVSLGQAAAPRRDPENSRARDKRPPSGADQHGDSVHPQDRAAQDLRRVAGDLRVLS